MINQTDRNPEVEIAALDDLLKSDGWEILQELVAEQFGPAAQLRDVDSILRGLKPGDVSSQHETVAQIRAASLAATRVMSLPVERLRAVKAGDKKPTILDRFADLRRGPRRA